MRIVCMALSQKKNPLCLDLERLAWCLREMGHEVLFLGAGADLPDVSVVDGKYDLVIVEMLVIVDFGGKRNKRIVDGVEWLNSLKQTKICMYTNDVQVETRGNDWQSHPERAHIKGDVWVAHSTAGHLRPTCMTDDENMVGESCLPSFYVVGWYREANGSIQAALNRPRAAKETNGSLSSVVRGREYNKQLDSFYKACDGSVTTTAGSMTRKRWEGKTDGLNVVDGVPQDEFSRTMDVAKFTAVPFDPQSSWNKPRTIEALESQSVALFDHRRAAQISLTGIVPECDMEDEASIRQVMSKYSDPESYWAEVKCQQDYIGGYGFADKSRSVIQGFLDGVSEWAFNE